MTAGVGARGADRLSEADAAALVLRVRGGDRDALGELYQHYRPSVARYLSRRVANSADVEDLVQETFIRVPELAAVFEPRTTEVGAWLCGRVARWTMVDYHRKERFRHLSAVDAAIDATRRGPVESAESRESRPVSPRVVTALARLTQAQRRAVQLRYLDGYSNAAAAKVAESSPGAVATNCLAARRRLRTDLADLAPQTRSWLATVSKVMAVRAALAEVGKTDVQAVRAWLRERGVQVDQSYVYAIRNGRRGGAPAPSSGPERDHAAGVDTCPSRQVVVPEPRPAAASDSAPVAPSVDETAAAVELAREAVAGVRPDVAERSPGGEAARRQQLARWSAADETAEAREADDGAADDSAASGRGAELVGSAW